MSEDMEKQICMENCEDDIVKLDDESSDDSLLVMQVLAHVENQVQVQENANANGQIENQVQLQENENENENGLAIQLFEEPSTMVRRCRAWIEAKGRQCAGRAISNNIYCCAHFSNKKGKSVNDGTPLCGGITIAGARCKHRSLYGRAFCKKHLNKVEKGQTSNSKYRTRTRTRTLKRKFEENCTDMVLVYPEIPLEINPVSVVNRDDSFSASVDVWTPISQVENHIQVQENNVLTIQYFHGEPSRNNNNKEWLEVDEPVAVWFKLECEEKWHAGIKCARTDWPLSIIRSKPTNNNQNKKFVIFSPKTKKYFWVDMLLVQSIHEFPHPIAYETHQDGLEFVQDVTIARQFIMQKLAGDMLHLVHLIHYNALIESARNVNFLKQFGMEAYKCHTYSELGTMVKKLQNNIVKQYIKANWKLHSYESWAERCKNANSAEIIELLQEELNGSILWKDIRALFNAPVQPKLSSEWETWKHDVMKCFATFHSFSSNNGTQQPEHASSSNSLRQANTHSIKCKICLENFCDEKILVKHWMENHTKEAQQLFRGYGCALCLDCFTSKKLLERHVQERHHVQFQEHLFLLLCLPCGRHFYNIEELQLHFMSVHPAELQFMKSC